MTHHPSLSDRAKTFAVIAAVLFGLSVLVGFAAHEVGVETAQARALVSQGAASFQKGDRAQAVLALERAELLSPRTSFVRSALARFDVPDPGTPVARTLAWITPHEWAFLTIMFGWIAGLSLAVLVARRGDSRFARRVVVASGVAFLLGAVGLAESNRAARELAIVTAPSGVLVAPYAGAGATADLSAGVVVDVGARYGDYVEVRGRDGARGWVTSGALESVVGAHI